MNHHYIKDNSGGVRLACGASVQWPFRSLENYLHHHKDRLKAVGKSGDSITTLSQARKILFGKVGK